MSAYISHKNTKSSNKEKIATELLENFFAPNSGKIELILYKELTPDIKQKLIYLKNEHKKQLIYFSTDFTTTIRKITNCPDNDLKKVQGKYDLFSLIYLRTLNQTRNTLGLPQLSIKFRIENELFKNPKTAFLLKSIRQILTVIFLVAFVFVMLYFSFILKENKFLAPFQPTFFTIFKISFVILIITTLIFCTINDHFKY